MSTEDEVRKVSGQFYAALNSMVNGGTGPMGDVWSHTADVTVMHPIGGRQIGWDEVRESFAQVAGLSSDGQVKLADQIVQIAGDVAYELGVEQGQAQLAGQEVTFADRVTNIYRRGPGGWKIVHHHTDISPAMSELLRNLQAGAERGSGIGPRRRTPACVFVRLVPSSRGVFAPDVSGAQSAESMAAIPSPASIDCPFSPPSIAKVHLGRGNGRGNSPRSAFL